MLHREIPFLRIGIPLCAGIVTGLYMRPGDLFFVLSFIALIFLFAFSHFYNRYLVNYFYGFILTLTMFVTGLFLYNHEKESISILPAKPVIVSGTISEFPEEKENTFRIILKMNSLLQKGDNYPVAGSIMLYQRKDTEVLTFLPGDRLIIRCTPVEISSRGNPFEFDYRFYMENQGIRYFSFTGRDDIMEHNVPERRKLIHKALIIREKIINMYRERGITGDRLALVAAITLGQKTMLDPEQKQYFMKAGVMHIMAVSGLHAVILSLFIFNVLFFMKGRLNVMRVMITILFLWSFAFVTGLTPSVLRATLMFTFLQAGNLMKRPVNGINSVLVSAFVLIILRPSVIFDAGFLLSYSAVIFIICFYRDFYLKLRFNSRLPDLIWQSAAVTIIAQLGTLPLTVMLFNRFPTWFILSNVVIVPLSSLVVITGCLVPLTFPVLFLSKLLAGVLSFLTGMTEQLTRAAAMLPYATIENIGFTIPECILLTIFIFSFTRFLLKRESGSIILPMAAFLCLLLAGLLKELSVSRSSELIVYNTIGRASIGIRTGKTIYLYSDTLPQGQEVTRHLAALNLRKKTIEQGHSPVVIQVAEKRILITRILNNKIIQHTSPDFVIITGKKPSINLNSTSSGNIEALIFSSEVQENYQMSDMTNVLEADTVHAVRNIGAFIRRL